MTLQPIWKVPKIKIKEKLLVSIYINKSLSCITCNKIQPLNNEEEFVTCKNCKMTTLASIFQTKLVLQRMIKTEQNKLENLTCFNNQIQSFCTLKCPTSMSQLKEDETNKLFLTTGQMRMIASKNTKILFTIS